MRLAFPFNEWFEQLSRNTKPQEVRLRDHKDSLVDRLMDWLFRVIEEVHSALTVWIKKLARDLPIDEMKTKALQT